MRFHFARIVILQMLQIEDANAPVVALVPEQEAVVVDESALEKKSPQQEKCDEYLLTGAEEELLNEMIVSVQCQMSVSICALKDDCYLWR